MTENPSARGAHGEKLDAERARLKRLAIRRGLVSLANDTKWDELIAWCRRAEGYVPQYRYRCIDSDWISGWDAEWYYHLPYPFLAVAWLDLTYWQEIRHGQLVAVERVDHSAEIEAVLQRIGLDYCKGEQMIRVYGYAPRDEEGLEA